MKRVDILLILAVLTSTATAEAPANAALTTPKITLRATANVQADYITLGDIADITPSPKSSQESARLAATIVGRSPLPGENRPLNRGDVILKLRQAGVDPLTVDIEGASDLVVTDNAVSVVSATPILSTVAATTTTTAGSGASPAVTPVQVAPQGPAVRPGDPVDVVLVDGPVTVHAKAYALNGGEVGSLITIRRDDADHTLSAVIIGEDQVQLEE